MAETTTRTFDWADEVVKAEGERLNEKIVVYEFNGGKRQFKEEEIHGAYEEA
jgi:hypothetical protein